MINVTVRFFGPLREIAQKEEMNLDLPVPCSGDTAFEALTALYPNLRRWKQSVRMALNLEYAQFSHELHDGDEISFIPPVSGG